MSAPVVVVGGGVVGASIAFHLARASVPVLLLEAGELAGGSSGKPLGGVRAQFSDPVNVELGLRSLAAFGRFAEELGTDIGLRRVGYLFLLRDPADVPAFEASVAMQNGLGVPSRMIGEAEARRLCPYVPPGVVTAAAWSAGDGWARPRDVVLGYARAAVAAGAEVRTGARVTGIDASGVRISGGATVPASAVVCAAGAWSGAVGELAGVELPVTPVRRQVAFTGPLPGRPDPLPFTIDYSSTAYLHGDEGSGALVGWADPLQEKGFDRSVSSGWHQGLRAALREFAPALAAEPLERGWAGLYETTPDSDALIGEADPGFRFLYATGFSGHGFLMAPAVGEVVRDLVLGREPAVDVAGLDAGRFGRGSSRGELNIV